MSEKRKRDPTFKPAEKNLLVNLVNKHFDIIECKKTDNASVRTKIECWKKLCEEFNSNCVFIRRDWQVLKNLWENVKKKAKSVMMQRRHNMYTIDEGSVKIPEDPLIDYVISLLEPVAEGVTNPLDGDTGFDEKQPNIIGIVETEEFEERHEEKVAVESLNYNPTMLQTPISKKLKGLIEAKTSETVLNSKSHTSPKNFYEEPNNLDSSSYSRHGHVLKLNNLVQSKIETLTFANQQAGEEHAVRMRILKLQEDQEAEKLYQEQLKTQLLLIQLQKAQNE